jgi:superoxide dismutase, Cu-Zn family
MNPTTPNVARRLGALAATTAIVLAACGSDDSDATATTDAPAATTDTADETADDAMADMDDDAMAGMDHDAMNMAAHDMGSADVTPADEVEGAALARGEYTLLDTRPAGYDDVAGIAVIARSMAGTTVTTEITGLKPNEAYISHLHEKPCSENGGDHFQFVDGTVEVPPNEVHLAFMSDDTGSAVWSAENDAVVGEDGVAFVVHPFEFIDNKIACVDFVADDADAVAEAIANGPQFDPSTIAGMEGMNMNSMSADDLFAMQDMDHSDHDDADHDDHAMDDAAMDDDEADHGDHDEADHGDHDEADHGDHDETDHGDHGDVADVGTAADFGALDVSALHAVDDQLAAGTLDVPAQSAVVDAAIAAIDEVGANDGNASLRAALVELQAALAAGDLDAAASSAATAHDVAHAMEGHDA